MKRLFLFAVLLTSCALLAQTPQTLHSAGNVPIIGVNAVYMQGKVCLLEAELWLKPPYGMYYCLNHKGEIVLSVAFIGSYLGVDTIQVVHGLPRYSWTVPLRLNDEFDGTMTAGRKKTRTVSWTLNTGYLTDDDTLPVVFMSK